MLQDIEERLEEDEGYLKLDQVVGGGDELMEDQVEEEQQDQEGSVHCCWQHHFDPLP